ncbi:MAG TPA: aminotransferase class III-fold pyridoxal phosphate-dependent enzyme [Acidimicrobiales bacterium]|nr:aminotransferase class III-fold pyridoxal phosphate-dependent enzyme [Acidimicrobiales bacterium]
MSGAPVFPPLAGLDDSQVPRVATALPGPRSAELWARDAAHHAGNSSPAAQWLELVIHDAAGSLVRDADGNVFLDFSSGAVVANLGHSPPAVVAALQEEAGRLMHYFDFATAPRAAFFDALAATLPPELQTFQMYSTGSEAVEAALRLAKSFTGGYEVMSLHRAWHGRTIGSMSLMGGFPLKHGYGPFVPGSHHTLNAYCYRCPLGLERGGCQVACAGLADRVYEESTERRLAAVIVEVVQGVGGVIPQPPEFLARLRALCDRTGALLIIDEILTGMGRTGTMWAFEQTGVVPDVLLAGKGLASGYPISVIASRREVLDTLPFGAPGAGASTFASGNLACAAGAATLGLLADGTVLEGARRVGRLLLDGLRALQDDHPLIGEVRGRGMLFGLELVTDRTTKARIPPEVARRLLLALARRGLLTAGAGPILRLTPPLVLTEAQAQRGLEILDQALGEVEGGLDR